MIEWVLTVAVFVAWLAFVGLAFGLGPRWDGVRRRQRRFEECDCEWCVNPNATGRDSPTGDSDGT